MAAVLPTMRTRVMIPTPAAVRLATIIIQSPGIDSLG
jgi:hypothetical protein